MIIQEEILVGNKLIAKSPFAETDLIEWLQEIPNRPDEFYLDYCNYHRDWNTLMSVVIKIFMTREVTDFIIRLGDVKIKLFDGTELNSPHKIELNALHELWFVVVDFIKWYNKTKEI